MKKLLIIAVFALTCFSFASSGEKEAEVIAVLANSPVPQPSVRLSPDSEYDQARAQEPCVKGSLGEGYIWIAPEFVLICTRSTGDLTVSINPTGNLESYRKVKEKVVDPILCQLLSSERRRWILWAAPDLVTFESEVTISDARVDCGDK